jgi:hypothetical protein
MELSLRPLSSALILEQEPFPDIIVAEKCSLLIKDPHDYLNRILRRIRLKNTLLKRKLNQQKEDLLKQQEESYQLLLRRIDYWNDRVYTRRTRYGISPSFNPITTFEKVLSQYCSIPWDWNLHSGNPFITANFIDTHPDKDWNWGLYGLSRHPAITPEIVLKYKHKPWCVGAGGLSCNPSMTLAFVRDHPKQPWCWGRGGLSQNPIVFPEFVEANPRVPWYWGDYGISFNPSMTLEFFRRHLDKPLHWGRAGISHNPHLTPEFILEFQDKPWCWDTLTTHRNITMEFIKEHPELPWNTNLIIINRNFTSKDYDELDALGKLDGMDASGFIGNLSLPFSEAEEHINELLEIYHANPEDPIISKNVIYVFEKLCTRDDLPRKFIQKHSSIIVKKIYQTPEAVNDAYDVFYGRRYLCL